MEKGTVVNVMMLGGRRCGKTSVIAAMRQCFEEVFGENSRLAVSYPSGDTMDTLEEKHREIEDYFNGNEREIIMDNNPSDEIKEYKLNISLKDKRSSVSLHFFDFPGELLEKGHKEDQDKLADLMKRCNIIMIVTDTVHLMEKAKTDKGDCVGMYNDRRNYCRRICNMVIENFKQDEGNFLKFPKMIMFVPLKCETYFISRRMNLVRERIHTAYREIFNFAGGTNKNNYEVVITPILTLGTDVEFTRFEVDENNKTIVDKDTGLPEKPLYVFNKPMDKCKYDPKFCDQPLVYSLAYLLRLTHRNMEAKKTLANSFQKFFLWISETFGNLASAEDFLSEEEIIKKCLKKFEDGYELVQNPLEF